MSDPDEDDDALSWAGDAERGRGPVREAPARHPKRGVRPETATSGAGEPEAFDDSVEAPDGGDGDDDGDGARGAALASARPATLAQRLVVAPAAVVYAVFTVLWILGDQSAVISSSSGSVLADALFQFGEFLSIVSCALWFGTTIVATRGRAVRVRAIWLAVGVVVLLPWPYLLLAGGR